MAVISRRFRCTPEDVFRVLENGWLYPSWVVGASRMRDVDEQWPTPGTLLEHSVGAWPLLINDKTTCTEWVPPHRMGIIARGWPIGEASVSISVVAHGKHSIVTITEEPSSGPATWLPHWLSNALLRVRNRETLHRLAYLAEGMATRSERDEPSTADTER